MTSQWDFYSCLVDDGPASIALCLDFQKDHPPLNTLYYVGLQILDPGDHGMGTQEDAEQIWALEDRLLPKLESAGLLYVGRLRNHGDWQLTFYGAEGLEESIRPHIIDSIHAPRGYRLGSKLDADWSYYHEFLWPPPERWQWMQNRRVVDALVNAGDSPERPRPVDHFVYFPDEVKRDAFAKVAETKGFSVQPSQSDIGVQLVREDPAELHHIHQVTMELIALASEFEGDYDGWGCPIRPE